MCCRRKNNCFIKKGGHWVTFFQRLINYLGNGEEIQSPVFSDF
ncbi:hypothetical protein HMPREF9103_01282 [Lentilactobacillus parafarraginis F0439]|uniref:Uncharacterized protein n=1 Tax=Lentilactobacillus parafarraginis F0439 TaxID=797515 RepID=G9ZNH9_9LACO|nr:hypothetical protein HMPREF9103_01282 [Lentilactobacillus parafarraginis F0439]